MNELSRRIGKFDSPESLLRAYEELEKEFTKRSQRLKDLERDVERLNNETTSREYHVKIANNMLADQEFVSEHVLTNDNLRSIVIEDYLLSLNKGTFVLGSHNGRAALTPPLSPRSLSEAKYLADKFLNN